MTNYYATLPKKRMAAAALIRDESGNILIVKPTYRPDWLLPGGIIEENESPRQACHRELHEELGVDGSVQRLLCIDYSGPDGEKTENLQFIFDGGIFHPTQIVSFQLPVGELSEFRFVTLPDALALLHPKIAKRLPHCLTALTIPFTAYLEEGDLIEEFGTGK